MEDDPLDYTGLRFKDLKDGTEFIKECGCTFVKGAAWAFCVRRSTSPCYYAHHVRSTYVQDQETRVNISDPILDVLYEAHDAET